jgi:hypothetical protein
MNIRIDHRISAACASSVALLLSACNGQLAVVDTLDSHNASLSSYRSDGSTLHADCACASSDSLMALSCGGGAVPLLDNDVVQTTADGGIVAFNLCNEDFSSCHVVYWDGGFAELPISSGLLIGLSASGAHVLTTGDGTDLDLIDLNGTTTIPVDAIAGHGSLSAAGDTVIGATYYNDSTQLVRVSTNTGEIEQLGRVGGAFDRAYVNAGGSAIVGFGGARGGDFAFRWSEQGGFSAGLSGVPAGITIWPEAVSADGTVIAGRSLPEKRHFRWTEAEGYVELAPAAWSSETFLSADGSVALGSLVPEGGQSGKDSSAFRWTEATGAVEIAPGVASVATDMSDDGGVVVATTLEEEQRNGETPVHTLVWDSANGSRSLDAILAARGVDTTGWEFEYARALSGDGKVLLGRATCGGVPTLYRIVLSD